jgi:phage gpG-like protein
MYRKISSVKSSLPTVLANEGTKFFVGSFTQQGFTDTSFNAWKPRKLVKGRLKNTNRRILVKTGRLRRAVNNSVKEKSFKRIVWNVNNSEVPYAGYQNYGDKFLPQRKFMGESKKLNSIFKEKITRAFKSIK